MRKLIIYVSSILALISAFSCTKEDKGSIELSSEVVNFGCGAGSQVITVATTKYWTLTSDSEWLTTDLDAGTGSAFVNVAVADNAAVVGQTPSERTGKLTITLSSGPTKTLTVIQAGETLVFNVDFAEETETDYIGTTLSVPVKANLPYSLSTDAEWITVPSGKLTGSSVSVKVRRNKTEAAREAVVTFTPDQGSAKTVKVKQQAGFKLKPVSTTSITDDMIFSTVCAATLTAAQQSFDFDDEYVYFTQLNNRYKNVFSWTRRKQITTSLTAANTKMNLLFFSHANNIYVEHASDGTKYVWLANYGTRCSDEKYRDPQILSRVPIRGGTTVRNTETKDNYYFGVKAIHCSIDAENNQIAVFSTADNYSVSIYKFSDVLAAPVKDIQLPSQLTYGGGLSDDPEWTGRPTVNAHDCSSLKPLHKFNYNYGNNGRSWQTIYLKGNRVYFFLAMTNRTNGMEKQSVIDVFNLEGTVIKKGILQPFADNMEDLKRYTFSDEEARTMENEGIIIRDGVLYLLYTAKNKAGTNRPVIFNLSTEGLE